MSVGTALLLALGSAILAIVYGAVSVGWILAKPAGNDRMQEIAAAIQEGAKAYMNRQYGTIAVVGVLLTIILALALLQAGIVFQFMGQGGVVAALVVVGGKHLQCRVQPQQPVEERWNEKLRVIF